MCSYATSRTQSCHCVEKYTQPVMLPGVQQFRTLCKADSQLQNVAAVALNDMRLCAVEGSRSILAGSGTRPCRGGKADRQKRT